MSIESLSAALKLRGLSARSKLILVSIANAHNSHTGECFPSQERICEEVNCSPSTLNVHLAALEQDNLIKRHTDLRLSGVLNRAFPEF